MNGWVRDYVGIPFVFGGSDHDGCDCWGLVRLIYREQLGVTLDRYSDINPRDMRRVARAVTEQASSNVIWSEIDTPAEFDVVAMRIGAGSLLAHVGIAVSERQFLHVENAAAASIVSFRDPMYRCRIVKTVRHFTR